MGDEGIVAWVAQIGEPLLVNDVRSEPKYVLYEDLKDTSASWQYPLKLAVRFSVCLISKAMRWMLSVKPI